MFLYVCKNVFIFFCSRLQAFLLKRQRFRLLVCKIFFILFIFFISVQRFFFFLLSSMCKHHHLESTTFALSGERTDMKSAPTAALASYSTCCKNVFISFFSRIYAFYQASRFRLFAYEIFLFFLFFLLALARFFFFLFFNTNYHELDTNFLHELDINYPYHIF